MKLSKKDLHAIFAQMGLPKNSYSINERWCDGFMCSFDAVIRYNGSPDHVPAVNANKIVCEGAAAAGIKLHTLGGTDYNMRRAQYSVQPLNS